MSRPWAERAGQVTALSCPRRYWALQGQEPRPLEADAPLHRRRRDVRHLHEQGARPGPEPRPARRRVQLGRARAAARPDGHRWARGPPLAPVALRPRAGGPRRRARGDRPWGARSSAGRDRAPGGATASSVAGSPKSCLHASYDCAAQLSSSTRTIPPRCAPVVRANSRTCLQRRASIQFLLTQAVDPLGSHPGSDGPASCCAMQPFPTLRDGPPWRRARLHVHPALCGRWTHRRARSTSPSPSSSRAAASWSWATHNERGSHAWVARGQRTRRHRYPGCRGAQTLPVVATPSAAWGVGAQAAWGAATGAGSRFFSASGLKREKRKAVANGDATR